MRKSLLLTHQSAGLAVLFLLVVRLAWHAGRRQRPRHDMSAAMRFSATLGHYALYAVFIALCVTGWMTSDAFGRGAHFLDYRLPALIPADRDRGDILQQWHLAIAYGAGLLVIGHAAAALWHHFILRDDVLRSMLPQRRRTFPRGGRRLILVLMLFLIAPGAQAIPSYTSQTGNPCTSCHVGGYGPQLTPYGMRFKIEGYTETGGTGPFNNFPLDLMVVSGFTHSAEGQPGGAAPHFGPNDNLDFSEIGLQFGGRITDHIGAYAEVDYTGAAGKIGPEYVDIRYASSVDWGGTPATFGLSLNSQPGLSDPFNTLPVSAFPYQTSDLALMPTGGVLLAGMLNNQVLGTNIYGFIDKSWYVDVGAYETLAKSFLQRINVDPSAGSISGAAPYWRLAYTKDLRKQDYSFGVFGFDANLHPLGLTLSADHYRDVGVDASYQYLGTRNNIVTLNASLIHEDQFLNATYLAGGAAAPQHRLDNVSVNASYNFLETYGVSVGWFDNWGSTDTTLYQPAAITGSRTGRPDSSGVILQADWTPFGKEDSWGSPFVNMRIGLQYTIYTEYNGAAKNYDGYGRDASGNDTLLLFVSTVF